LEYVILRPSNCCAIRKVNWCWMCCSNILFSDRNWSIVVFTVRSNRITFCDGGLLKLCKLASQQLI
jgi:hypothetical protein